MFDLEDEQTMHQNIPHKGNSTKDLKFDCSSPCPEFHSH